MIRRVVVIDDKSVVVEDELCDCGHLRSEHNTLIPNIPSLEGHGACQKCRCIKFTFHKFIIEGEKS